MTPDRLILGDALEVLGTLPDASVDAIVTDPPWMDYATGRYDASAWHRPIATLLPAAYMALLGRVLRRGGALMLWCRWDCFEAHASAVRDVGLTVRNCIVWAKPNHTAGDLAGNLGNMHEMAVFATQGRWTRSATREVNVWHEPHLFSRAQRDHPTQKPLGLMARAVRLCCPSAGLVLGPFAGSGTTAVACIQTGRRFIAIEKDAAYHAIAAARIAAAEAQPRLLPVEAEAGDQLPLAMEA
jgi:site-specific DNA-methyltransferase (adenine-specific)